MLEISADKTGLLELAKHGLQASNTPGQIGIILEYEAPVRLSTATLIGRCRIGAFTYIGGGSEVRNSTIGRFCSIAANATIGPAEHPIDWLSSHPFQFDGVRYFDTNEDWNNLKNSTLRFKGNSSLTEVGHDVWIGRNAIIKQGIRVGNGAIVAGGAFVATDVPDYAIVGGTPARVIRYRFDPETIEILKNIEWWNYRLDSEKNDIDFSDIKSSSQKIKSLLQLGKLKGLDPEKFILSKNNENPNRYRIKKYSE
jgi:acetyltransferase-like isoleucine patch superfamily enzyme